MSAIVGSEFGFRRPGKQLAGIYPTRAAGGACCPPTTTFGQNSSAVPLNMSATTIATTDAATLDGSTDIVILVSFEVDVPSS